MMSQIMKIQDSSPKGNKYEIYKTINGRKKYYGSFDTLKEAQKRRDELIVDNWGLLF